jgi:hypothetical protein
MSAAAPQENNLPARLNRECLCVTVDHDRLTAALESDPTLAGLGEAIRRERPHLFTDTAVFLSAGQVARMAEVVRVLEAVRALPGYREAVLAHAPAAARFDPGTAGVFLGFDFHLSDDGPKLIEINTNAGGALLNARLALAQQACCPETGGMRIGAEAPDKLGHVFVEMFRAEWRRVHGDAPLESVAIVDDAPRRQYLYPEFLLFQSLFHEHGIEAVIADPRELAYCHGRLFYADAPIQLVYNRLTDFTLAADAHVMLRNAYLDGKAVVTPHPRAHALYADKRNLALLCDPQRLRALGAPPEAIEALRGAVPRTVAVTPDNREELWAGRRRLFFKPVAGYGSRAAYRGDKITKRVWEEIGAGGYVAQDIVPPGERQRQLTGAPAAFKFDVRCFAYDGEVQLLAARLYQGQTTNFRTAGGGFAPVFYPASG